MTPDKGSLASVSPLSPYTSSVVSASTVRHEPVHAPQFSWGSSPAPENLDESEWRPKLKHGSLANPPRWEWFLPRSRAGAGNSARAGTTSHVSWRAWRASLTDRPHKRYEHNYERPRPRDRGTRFPPPPLVG